jgi:hypothetical protein
MALPGISNANEFYSAHYLESVLTGDIKKVRERWTGTCLRHPRPCPIRFPSPQ